MTSYILLPQVNAMVRSNHYAKPRRRNEAGKGLRTISFRAVLLLGRCKTLGPRVPHNPICCHTALLYNRIIQFQDMTNIGELQFPAGTYYNNTNFAAS
jgi:hypothetical protein